MPAQKARSPVPVRTSGADLGVGLGVEHGLAQLGDDGGGERVAGLRPVEAHDGDGAVPLDHHGSEPVVTRA